MRETAIGLMAKYPKSGQVKTRLARGVGEERALAVYRCLLRSACDLLNAMDAREYLRAAFVFPHARVDEFKKQYEGVDLYFHQQGGDLGDRMGAALRTLLLQDGVSGAILVGADCPDLSPEHIATGAELLTRNDVVIGPTSDGGYYLIGIRQVHDELFSGISWGTRSVYEETLNIASASGLSVAELPMLRDLDDEDDLNFFTDAAIFKTATSNQKG